MHEHDLEKLLTRYRPAAPRAELAAAITRLPFDVARGRPDDPSTSLGAGQITRFPRTWPWAVAAAALLTISVGLHAAVAPAPDTSPLVDAQRVQAIAEELGGSPESQVMAEWIVRREARVEQEARVARLAVRGIDRQ